MAFVESCCKVRYLCISLLFPPVICDLAIIEINPNSTNPCIICQDLQLSILCNISKTENKLEKKNTFKNLSQIHNLFEFLILGQINWNSNLNRQTYLQIL